MVRTPALLSSPSPPACVSTCSLSFCQSEGPLYLFTLSEGSDERVLNEKVRVTESETLKHRQFVLGHPACSDIPRMLRHRRQRTSSPSPRAVQFIRYFHRHCKQYITHPNDRNPPPPSTTTKCYQRSIRRLFPTLTKNLRVAVAIQIPLGIKVRRRP
jgi:hypothetical protein